jgi:serine/threonine protein kinase
VYNNKSDQFALGCIVFELIFGAKLFRNEDWRVQIFSQNPEIVFSNLWPVQQSSEILKTFRQLVVSLITIDPSSRPSARETKVTLESIAGDVLAQDEGPMGHASTKAAIVPTDSLNQPPDDDGGGVRYDDGGSTGDDGAAKSGEGTAGSDGDAVGYWN